MNAWVSSLQKAKKTCLLHGNLKKVHYALSDGSEMVEEYDTNTYVLTRRAWKIKNELHSEDDWKIEVGDPEPTVLKDDGLVIKENSSQPFVVKRITKRNIEWRIRNLPYPLETYSVSADQQNRSLVVRTSNKKYFKKIEIPELDRVGLLPEQDRISFTHKFNTLIITYSKPKEVSAMEEAIVEEVRKLKPKNEGEPDCKPS